MIALIIAGGFAKRMWPVTKDIPKGLLEIKGKPILQWQIEELRKFGIKDIVICCGYLSEQIEERFGDGSSLGVHINYSIEKEPLGTAGAIKNAEKFIKETFIDINGDLFFDVDLKSDLILALIDNTCCVTSITFSLVTEVFFNACMEL